MKYCVENNMDVFAFHDSGNILFYSHDYETINTVANRIIEIKQDGIYDYSGTYEEYIAYKKSKGMA